MENEELNLDELDQIETNTDNRLKVKNRFQQLSEKVKTEAQAREEVEAKLKAEAEARLSAERQTEFYKNLTTLSAKYPEAINFQDKILERVNKGYDQEEAIIAVLGKEGKLGSPAPEIQKNPNIEGGSAITNVSETDKQDLSMNDKLAALQDLEKSGELQQVLRAGINRS